MIPKNSFAASQKMMNFGHFCLGNGGVEMIFFQIPKDFFANPKNFFGILNISQPCPGEGTGGPPPLRSYIKVLQVCIKSDKCHASIP